MARKTFGNLKPEHTLLLNPHAETKLSRCPRCEKLTYPRKFAFLIHVERWGLCIQGITCKYCSRCRMIMVQQHKLEAQLAFTAQQHCPAAFGQEYLLIGVVDNKTFKAGLTGQPAEPAALLDHVSDFRKQIGLGFSPGGWYPAGKEPPMRPFTRPQIVPRPK